MCFKSCFLNRFSAFIFDCDGVIWKGDHVIPGAREVVNTLQERGKLVLFATNNASLSRRTYAEKMRSLGFNVDPREIYCSSYVTAKLLSGKVERVYVVGEEGLIEELELAGLKPVDSDKAECVVVGLDRGLTYSKLSKALACLLRGALFVATNRDPTLPTESGLALGAGAIVAALEAASGRSVDIVAGKPFPFMFELALKDWNLEASKTLVVGDRLDTDVAGAKRAGLASALVLSGVTSLDEVRSAKVSPDFVLRSITDLVSSDLGHNYRAIRPS